MGEGDVTQVAAPDPGQTRFIARIEASPDQHTATLNQKVTYRIVLEESTHSIHLIGWGGEEQKVKTPRAMFDETGRTTKDLTDDIAIGSDNRAKPSLKQLKPRINWYVLYDKNGDGKADAYEPYDPELRIRHNPTDVEFEWKNEGQHVVLCYIGDVEPSLKDVSIAKLAETQLLFRQWVGSYSTVQFRQFRDAKSKGATNPFVEHESLKKYLSVIDAAKQYRPAPPNKEKQFAEEISDYEDYLAALGKLMPEIGRASSFNTGADLKAREIEKRYKVDYSEARLLISGLAHLLPVASYVSKDTPERRPIRLCLFYRWEFRDTLHMLHVSLVDWTNPTDKRLCGRYDASDTSPYKAVTAAIEKWRDENKYYHPGNLKVEIPKIPMPPGYNKAVRNDSIQVNFDTRENVWDKIQTFLSAVSLWLGLAAALLALIVPIPGAQLAAPLVWEALFAGAVASGISIARRRDQGFADWREDALDLLGIVDAVFKVGRVAGKLAWSRGASMATKQISAKFEKFIAYGEWTRDKLEMLLIADKFAEQFADLLSTSDLDPKERVDKLREFLVTTGVGKGTSYINVRAAKRLAKAQDPPQIPPDTLAKLNDPKAVIDLDKLQRLAENTKNKVVKTTTQDEPGRTVNPGDGRGGKPPTGGKGGGGGGSRRGGRRFPWPEKKDDGWKVYSVDNPDLIHLERKKEKDGHAFYFKAGIEGKSVWIDLETRLVDPSGDRSLDKVSEALGNAGSLFRSMFEHFEGRIEGWHGYFRKSNFEAIKETVEHLRKKNTPKSGYEKVLFDYSYTGPNWRKWLDEQNRTLHSQGERLEIEIIQAEPDAGKPQFHFRVKFNRKKLPAGA